MTVLPTSSSDARTNPFDRLHPGVQRWIWDKGWTALHDIQAQAIEALVAGSDDILIAAATASGKTEAAFLPIISKLAEGTQTGVRALYVGPLKALINDQFERLEDLCDRLAIPVTKWHGDASEARKRRLRERPSGVVLITPESLEAMFVRRPESLTQLFGALEFVVIDELHVFLDSERGVQLASLLKRLDTETERAPRRVGLSATIGDLTVAAKWLRPDDPRVVTIIESHESAASLQLQIRGIEEPIESSQESAANSDVEMPQQFALDLIATHLFRTLRSKGNHLVFAGSRRNTEALSDRLRLMCEEASVPNEFFPHHGNLSRETRESLEQRLREGHTPTTAVATSTLELGIDIGSVESVAQLGAPASISSLRQRLGRSGRREGNAAIIRIYTVESDLTARSSVFERLRAETVQAIAAVRLLLGRWIEPPSAMAFHLSTLLHQTLSMIAERGGIAPQTAYKLLAGEGPFEAVTPEIYSRLLRAMHDREQKLIEQAPDGTLMLGPLGERLTSHYDFYSVFITYDEYTISTETKTLGTLSVTNALGPDDFLIFAGQRWKVKEVDDRNRKVLVEPAPAGRVPKFEGEAAPLHDRLVQEMRNVYLDTEIPVYLDSAAKAYLEQGRIAFREFGLDKQSCIAVDGRVYLFPWAGTRKLDSLRLCLRYCGLQVEQGRIALSVSAQEGERPVLDALKKLEEAPPPADGVVLLSETLRSAKYDYLLPDDLLRFAFINDRLDIAAARNLSKNLVAR